MCKTFQRSGGGRKTYHEQVTQFIQRMYPTISCPISAEFIKHTDLRTQKIMLNIQTNEPWTLNSADSGLPILFYLKPPSLNQKV